MRSRHNTNTKNRLCKRQETFLGPVMRREKLEHLVTTGMIEEKLQKKMLDGLTQQLGVGRVADAPD